MKLLPSDIEMKYLDIFDTLCLINLSDIQITHPELIKEVSECLNYEMRYLNEMMKEKPKPKYTNIGKIENNIKNEKDKEKDEEMVDSKSSGTSKQDGESALTDSDDDSDVDDINIAYRPNKPTEISFQDSLEITLLQMEDKWKDYQAAGLSRLCIIMQRFYNLTSDSTVSYDNAPNIMKILKEIVKEYELLKQKLELIIAIASLEESKKKENEFISYDNDYNSIMTRRNELENRIYTYQKSLKFIRYLPYQSIGFMSDYMNGVLTYIHTFVTFEQVNEEFEELNSQFQSIIKDFQNDFNQIRSDVECQLLPLELKEKIIKLLDEIPTILPEDIDELYTIYNVYIIIYLYLINQKTYTPYKDIVKTEHQSFEQLLSELSNILPEIEKELPPYIRLTSLKTILKITQLSITNHYQNLKEIYETRNNIERETKQAIPFYQNKINKIKYFLYIIYYYFNRDDIDLSMKQIDEEESLYKTIETFQKDHLISIDSENIVELFKKYRECNDDYSYVIQCAKDKVNILVY